MMKITISRVNGLNLHCMIQLLVDPKGKREHDSESEHDVMEKCKAAGGTERSHSL